MSRGWLFGAVFLATFLFQSPVLQGEFLFYDDARFVVRNESIDSLSNTGRFFSDLSTTASVDAPTADIYRPLRTFSYAVVNALAGKSARAFHMASLLFHAAAAGLLALVLLQAGLTPWPALAGAVAWGLHPVTVEASAWICSLGDVMCGFFALLSLLAYARNRLVLAILALVVALLAKEAAVVMPGIWLAWDFFFRREELKRRVGTGALPALGVVLAFLVWRGALVGAGMSQTEQPLGGSHGNAIRTMLAGYGFYCSTVFFPFGSTVDVRVPVQASVSSAVLGGGLLLGLTILAVFRGPTRTRLAAAWFLLALVPASNVIIPLKIPTADRFLYLPLMAIGFVVGEACERWPRRALWAAPVSLLLLGGLTIHRIGDWRDDASLVAAWGRVNPKSERLLWAEASQHAKRAIDAMQAGNWPDASQQHDRANQLYSLFVQNVQGRGNVPIQVWMEAGELSLSWARFQEERDQTKEAIRSYTAALTWFRMAFERQKAKQGRVVEEEVVRAASAVADICTRLADMQNPQFDKTIREGMKALQFLEREFGQDIGLRFARLLLAYSARIRAEDPAKARGGFDQVLTILDKAQAEGVEGLTYLRAQCIYYKAFLKPYSRSGVRTAYNLYLEAAEESPSNRYWCYFYAASCKCSEGKVFKDEESFKQGREILAGLDARARAEGVRLPTDLRHRIASELGGCASRE
ncbi:MAG: hypothetical protein ACYS0F_05770 [Planctomycetota bacterium]|jgi:hypothetical protein